MQFVAHLVITQCLVAAATQKINDTATFSKEDCPPWMKKDENGTCICMSSGDSKIFDCNEDRSLDVLACYCVSYYSDLNMTVFGNCLYSCSLRHSHRIKPHELEKTCNKFNREGELCGECQAGKGSPIYSYSLWCVECEDTAASVIKYITFAFLPLTVFYIVVVTLRMSVTSEKLNGFVLISQIVSTPIHCRYLASLYANKPGSIAFEICISLFSVWNLDFFKSLYEPFCINNKMSSMTIVSLDFIIALYPLFLIFLTYIAAQIHDNIHIVKHLCRPIFSRLSKHFNMKRSLIDSFATFILLSYIKILNATFDILLPTTLYNMSGDFMSKQYLYYDGTKKIFHHSHAGYAILALTMTFIFNITPLLILLLYPCNFFQRFLNRCCKSRHQLLLHMFMDSFQGCYRTSPLDCRYFAAINLLLRFGNLIIFSITLNMYYYFFGCILFMGMATLTVVMKPYKSSLHNTLDVVLFLATALGYLGGTAYALSPKHFYNRTLIACIGTSLVTVLFYLLSLLLYTLCPKRLLRRILKCFRNRCNQELDKSPESTPLLHALKTSNTMKSNNCQRPIPLSVETLSSP